METTCMICLNEQITFEESNVNFDDHVEVDHNIWLYPYYIKYLMSKDFQNYTGDEVYVWNNYMEERIEWMPHKETLSLKQVFFWLTFFNRKMMKLMKSWTIFRKLVRKSKG